MATRSSIDPVGRVIAWVPTQDTGRTRALDPGALFSAGRQWTPFGLNALGHTISVNPTTGGVVISANDLSIPYQGMPLQVSRLLDVQEQHSQQKYLEGHPNTDPRFHYFANWQLQTESQVTATWNHALPELLVSDGDGESALFYREYPHFDVNNTNGGSLEDSLRSYGVPGRTLAALNWQFTPFDSLLRTRRGPFAILTGQFEPETMVDSVNLRLWRFEPINGMAYRYTSEFSYNQLIDNNGVREVTVPSVIADIIDSVGHRITFRPVEAAPPYRGYVLADGSGRSFKLELNDFISYLDGNNPSSIVKCYVISRAIDQTRNAKNVINYRYDQNQRLVEVHYPGHAGGADRVVKYDYDPSGHLVRITDPVGDSFRFEYAEDLLDSDERLEPRLKLTRILDEEGNSIAYVYDHPHGKVAVTFTGSDGTARSATFSYMEDVDDTGQRFITSQSILVTRGYSGNQSVNTSQKYSNDGRYLIEEFTDALGKTFVFEYNQFNQTTAYVDPTGHQQNRTFDVQASPNRNSPNRYDLIKISEQNIDIAGNIFLVESTKTFRRYDNNTSNDAADLNQSTHRKASETDELGHTSTYDYDDPGNTAPLSPTTITDALNKQTLRTYDPVGSLLSETNPSGNTWRWGYNPQGQRVIDIDANGFKSYWVYDAGTGWLTDATDALGSGPGDPAHSLHYDWNEAGQLLKQTDAVGDVTDYAYYRNKRLRSITGYDPAARTTSFDYDASGTLSLVTDPLGHETFFQIDEAGRVYETFRDNPANPSIRLTFDPGGHVIELTDRNGQQFNYGYDDLGRMTTIQEPDWPAAAPVNPGKAVQIKYDLLGHRLKVTDNQLPSAVVYRYDAAGNQRERVDPFGFSLTYDYNIRNEIIRAYDNQGWTDLRFERDDSGRLTMVTDGTKFDASRQFRYIRTEGNLVDNLYRIEFDGSGLLTRFRYDRNRRLIRVSHLASGQNLARFGYVYRPDGLLESITGDHQGAYSYDGLKRLIGETDTAMQNGYDGVGNRRWRSAQPLPPGQQDVYDSDNRLVNSPPNGTTFTYDTDGNRLTKTRGGATVHYTFDGASRLMKLEDGPRVIDYLYDIDGRLLQRAVTVNGNVSTDRFCYANRSILSIADSNGALKFLFTRDDEGRLLRKRSPAVLQPAPSKDTHSLFYLHDGLRSVARLVDWDANGFLKVDYDAWGNGVSSGQQSNAEFFRYRGALQDLDTRLLNFGARWYEPGFGRWVSQDPLLIRLITAREDTAPNYREILNLYAYVYNNPLTFYDPEGLIGNLPRGWPQPPGWKGGYKWTNEPNGTLRDPDGNTWHWHPEDSDHNEHWDKQPKRGPKQRVDRDGDDLGEDAFKPDEPTSETSDEEKADDGKTAKRVVQTAATGVVAVGAGVIAWEIGKWVVAGLLAPETGGASLVAAAVTP